MTIRLGTRASALAQWQAEWVAARLRKHGADVELVLVTTTGDRQSVPIEQIGGEGVFTKEIQRALLDRRIDLAVHSLKDLPTDVMPGLVLAAVPERGPVGDVLVSGQRQVGSASPTKPFEVGHAHPTQNCPLAPDLSFLPLNAVIGTGSLRRRTQLLHVRGDLVMKDIRGNVETRLHKLEQGEYDALILAEAGLQRLGFLSTNQSFGFSLLPLEWMLPAVGQGALGLETREDDFATRDILAKIDHPPTHMAVLAERAVLSTLQGGCLAPIAVLGQMEKTHLTLTGRVMSCDGVERLEAKREAILISASERVAGGEGCQCVTQLGQQVAKSLLDQGAAKLIATARHSRER
jgi:hydroxymethylbilane synthase